MSWRMVRSTEIRCDLSKVVQGRAGCKANRRADRLGNMRGVDVAPTRLDDGEVFDDAAMDALLSIGD